MTTVLRRRKIPTAIVPGSRHDPRVKVVHDGPRTFHVAICPQCAEDHGLHRDAGFVIFESTSRHGANRAAVAHRG